MKQNNVGFVVNGIRGPATASVANPLKVKMR